MCYFQSSPKNPTSVKSKTPSQRIKSSDFRAWDQFDADTAADHVDRQAEREEEEEREVRCNGVAGKTSVPVELSESGKSKILYFHTRNIHTYVLQRTKHVFGEQAHAADNSIPLHELLDETLRYVQQCPTLDVSTSIGTYKCCTYVVQ